MTLAVIEILETINDNWHIDPITKKEN